DRISKREKGRAKRCASGLSDELPELLALLGPPALFFGRTDLVAERPYPGDFKLQDVANLKLPADLQTGTVADCAGANQIARLHELRNRDIGQQLAGAPNGLRAVATRAFLAVDPNRHLEIVETTDLVHRHDPWADSESAILALPRTHTDLEFDFLDVARAKIVEDRDAKQCLSRFFGRPIVADASDDIAQLQFVIEVVRVERLW